MPYRRRSIHRDYKGLRFELIEQERRPYRPSATPRLYWLGFSVGVLYLVIQIARAAVS